MGLTERTYAIVLLLEGKLVAFWGPYGIRLLVLGNISDGGWIVPGKDVPIDIIGGKCIRDIQPGEMAVTDQDGLRSFPMDQE